MQGNAIKKLGNTPALCTISMEQCQEYCNHVEAETRHEGHIYGKKFRKSNNRDILATLATMCPGTPRHAGMWHTRLPNTHTHLLITHNTICRPERGYVRQTGGMCSALRRDRWKYQTMMGKKGTSARRTAGKENEPESNSTAPWGIPTRGPGT